MKDGIIPAIISTILSVVMLGCMIFMAYEIFIGGRDNDIWNSAIEQADNFVYHHKSRSGNAAIFHLYDENEEYICEAIVDMPKEKVDIYNHSELITSHYANERKSKKMFDLLYPKIPQEVRVKYLPKSEVIKRMKNMK